jgi:hypothetical protein
LPGEPFVPDVVSRVITVLTTVSFYDEAPLAADEIGCVGADRFLPYKFKSVQPSRTKLIPKRAFGICGDAA